ITKNPGTSVFSNSASSKALHPDAPAFLNGLVNADWKAFKQGRIPPFHECQKGCDKNALFVAFYEEFMADRFPALDLPDVWRSENDADDTCSDSRLAAMQQSYAKVPPESDAVNPPSAKKPRV
ncbi:MAG: hypothetical protein Q7U84_07265, partial [Polynucleobacter sp.]|nr:hypothetical protein [Polynucleobacter sp.]